MFKGQTIMPLNTIWHINCLEFCYKLKKPYHLQWRNMMMKLKDIKKHQNIIDAIDWDMTPEEAVRLYLEWGNNWAGGNYVIRSKDDTTHYFVVNTWKDTPIIYLIQRNSEEAKELAEIEIPEVLKKRYIEINGKARGVYSIEGEIKDWLKKELDS